MRFERDILISHVADGAKAPVGAFVIFGDMKKRGFTLVEMLITIGVILVLAVIGIPVGASCIENARAAKEIAGGRNLVSAWMSYAADNNGSVLPGYLSMSQASAAKVTNKNGSQLAFPTSARYPFRLAPYLDYQLKGNILINKQVSLVDDYEISMAPSLGLNLTFVGGDFGGGSDLVPNDSNYATYGKFVVTNINEIYAPSKLLVFASARITDANYGDHEGYNAVKSPNLQSKRWPDSYNENAPYYDFGAVHPRFNKRAVCAMADGHIELLKIEELLDMRRWSNQAAQADDPNWVLAPVN